VLDGSYLDEPLPERRRKVKVSIVICNYNYASYLDGAIRSALWQDHPDTEVIVVDDGSTDDSRAIITQWGAAVRAVYKANGGQVSAYNAGFELVTGDIVLFLDSDDCLDRTACSRVVQSFRPGIAKVHFRLRLVDEKGAPLGTSIPSRLSAGNLADRLRVAGELYDSSPGSGNAYRVDALRKLMPIVEDARDRHGADFFAIYGCSLLGDVAVAGDDALGSYRVHRRQATDDLVFGNANPELHEPYRMRARHARLKRWVVERLGERFDLAPASANFSLEKQGYAIAIFNARGYLEGLRAGAPLLASNVLPAIGLRQDPWFKRAMLAGWALGVLVLPRRAGLPLARFVCNPASR
jgi:glycosyltransferase involved in cell wall biosynthesis